ncbi:MAG: hypothetical protein WCX30_00975 [Candidatus Paceibacterota bacterium]|jgi:hypothetical protein|nr:hypothetical protein [bacterium]
MQVRVPQFIEHDPKLLGPFTLSQTLYVGAALFGTFILYLLIGQKNFFLFLFLSGLLFAIAIFLAFYKVEGLSIPYVIKNSLDFNMKTKLYIWKRKEIPIYISLEKKKEEKEDPSKKSPLKMTQNGSMDKLMRKIDFEK